VVLRLLLVVALLLPAGSAPPLAAHPLAQEAPGTLAPPEGAAPGEDDESAPSSVAATATITATRPLTTTAPAATETLTATVSVTAPTAWEEAAAPESVRNDSTPTATETPTVTVTTSVAADEAGAATPTLTVTLTATPTATATETMLPPATPTLTVTLTATETLLPAATPTITAAITATATATVTLTATLPAATAIPTEDSPLAATPAVTVTATLTATPPLSPTLTVTATPVLTTTATPTVTPTLTETDPLTVTPPVTVTRPSTTPLDLDLPIAVTATVPVTGGKIEAFGGRVAVRFPAGAAAEALTVRVRPLPEGAAIPYSLSPWPFEIVAEGAASKRPVTRFQQPLQIEIHYEDEWIRGDEESLALFYFDEERQGWAPLPSRVDTKANILVGESDHLTVFDFDPQNWEAAKLPTLAGFQVGQFSGAAQYSYAFDLPPGPGGWQPQLTLGYNSQAVDSATNQTQAAWVGMGWSLDTGYVERDMRGTKHLGDDSFTLVLGGASHRLLPDGTGRWRTEEDAYLRIQYSANVDTPRLLGDRALRLNNANADWAVTAYRTVYNVQDSEVAQVQFRLASNGAAGGPAAILALETDNGRRWGISVKADNSVVVQMNNGGGFSEVATLLAEGAFKRDRWYVLQLGVDSSDLVQLWERDAAPESGSVLRYQASQVAPGQNWRFRAWSYGGTLHVDTYAELKLLAETETKTDATQTASWARTSPSGNPLLGLAAYWQRPAYEKRLLFNGDALFTGTLTEYEYQTADQNGAQYGNLTRIIEKGWNGSSFVAYRATRRLFYPNDGASVYLVGLVGHEGVYTCPGGSCSYGDTNVQGVKWYVYDSNNWYNLLPSQGKLTKQRTLVCYATGANVCVGAGGSWTRRLFSDVILSYDGYGNLLSTTSYPGYGYQEGGTTVYPTANPRTTSYTYDTYGYNTYRRTETNPLGQGTTWDYYYRLSAPTVETDANGIVTTAEYDPFGRLTKIIRPGDTSATPTVWVRYLGPGAANNQPFFITLSGPHQGGTWVQRKVYDGLGNLLQTQVGNAQINGAAADSIVDYQYNGYGQVTKQTMPYTIGTWNGSGNAYRGQQLSQPATVTSYDGLGRLTRVQSPTNIAPNSEHLAYSYPADLQVRTCDGRGNCTTTTHDLWGRVAEVRPPLDPWLQYTYDEAGRLRFVQKRTGSGVGTLFAETEMRYDLAGRKTWMKDPDLGIWTYTYNAAHNLATQTDARNCQTTLLYDNLSRVTQKSYSGSCGVTTSAVFYGYDAFTAGSNLGRGQRTSMSDGSGNTSWTYGDARGRLTRESKTISGGGTYLTQ
jgi:YD repeat-containing protein